MARLVPMSPQEFERFREWTTQDYAESNVRIGAWESEGAQDRAREEVARLLPDGQQTEGHSFWTIRRETDGLRVGELWQALRPCPGGRELFIYWIGIDAAHRRHGYASAALAWVERAARSAGARRLSLHVFGDNPAAIATYRRFGFTERNLLMSKPIGTETAETPTSSRSPRA